MNSSQSAPDQAKHQGYLLSVKLRKPLLPKGYVPRPRLLAKLEEGLNKKLILVSAPAGFGKTSLLASWLQHNKFDSAWLSLDQEDNDPSRFLRYLAAVFREINPGVGDMVDELLDSPQPQLKYAALTALLNQTDRLTDDAILVLDDYHLIENQKVHQILDYLISYLPPTLHLVISSRSDPPLTLSRMRGYGEILDIRMSDLRFSSGESRIFLGSGEDQGISEMNLSQLLQKTEGWVSGLQMAKLSLRGVADRDAFVASFSGSSKYILDYLIEEVLEQQSKERQDFLLCSSLLERLSGPLCDAVLGLDSSQGILEELEAENLFLVPLDDQRCWYRYHQLFRELLHYRLEIEYPERIADLYRQASIWYQENGWDGLAINCSLESGDIKRAVQLISEHAPAFLMRSEVNTFRNWLDKLPEEVIQSNSQLAYLDAWAMMISGEKLDQALEQVESLGDNLPEQKGRILAMKAFNQITRGEFEASGQTAKNALEFLPNSDCYFRGLAIWILGIYHSLQKNIANSLAVLTELSQKEELQRHPMMSVMVLSQIARAHFHLGNFQQARVFFEQALDAGRDRQGNWVPIAGEALMGLGDLLREQNQLGSAYDSILEGIELTQQWRPAAAIEGYLFLARVKQLEKDWEAANQAVERAQKVALDFDVMEMDDRIVAMWQARLWSFQGALEPLENWIQSGKLLPLLEGVEWDGGCEFDVDRYLLLREKVVLAMYLLQKEQYDDVLNLTEALLGIFQEHGRLDFLIEISLIEAVAYAGLTRMPQAYQALGQALDFGEKGGFLGLFLEWGPEMRDLISAYAEEKGSTPYIKLLLEAFLGSVPADIEREQFLLDPLSDREIEVLKYLPSNLTTPEIADQLVVSVNTVRTHIKNIYQKLGAHKRSEAVNKAQELKII